MGRQHGEGEEFARKIVGRLAAVIEQLRDLARRCKGCAPIRALCEGFLEDIEGLSAKACDPTKGAFTEAITLSAEAGTVVVEARARLALAELSRDQLPARISMGLKALEGLQKASAHADALDCLMLLAQLDPKSTEFRELAKLERRKSSSRGSVNSLEMAVMDMEKMEDVPLAGRRSELTLLIKITNALRTATDAGEGVSIVLSAAGGMGKTALLRSFTKDVQQSMGGVKVLSSATSQFEMSTPFFVWKNIFSGVLSLFGGKKKNNSDAKDVLLATLGDAIGPDRAKSWHPLLNPLLPFSFEETKETEHLTNAARMDMSMQLYYDILENQKHRLLICIEDAHWCDESSLTLISMCHDAPNLVVVVTARPEDGVDDSAGLLKGLLAKEGTQLLTLEALDESALREHIAGLLQVEYISDQLLKLIEQRTGGNLLYIQELVSSLIESGMLLYNDTGVDLKNDVEELVVPDNVQAVIASRLAGLTPSQQSLLQTASVIGREFTLNMVVEVHPASEMLQSMSRDMKELVRKRLVERVIAGGGDESSTALQFSHKFVQESVYQSCLVSNRKQVHRSIAKHIEIVKNDQLPKFYGIVAHHYLHAEEWRNASLYLQLAGEVNEQLNSTKAVVEILNKWIDVRSKLNIKGSDPAVNGRFSSAIVEEGVVFLSLSKALQRMQRYAESRGMAVKAMKNLGTPFPIKKLRKIKIIVKGFARLQKYALLGGHDSYDLNPSEAKTAYYESVYQVAYLSFRNLNDNLSYLSALFMMLDKRSPEEAGIKVMLGLVFVTPALGLNAIHGWTTSEVNRLSATATNEIFGSAASDMCNGYAYSSRGELKQATAFFSRSAAGYMQLRDMDTWCNAASFACMCMLENGNVESSLIATEKAIGDSLAFNSLTATGQLTNVMLNCLIFVGCDSDRGVLFCEMFDKKVAPMFTVDGIHPVYLTKFTQLPFVMWKLGVVSAEDCARLMLKMQAATNFMKVHLFLGDRASATWALWEFYDWSKKQVSKSDGKSIISSSVQNQLMAAIIQNTKFIEMLGKRHPWARCWGMLFRGCLLRRLGKTSSAIQVLTNGIEAANRSSSRVCLALLWLERGHCDKEKELKESGSFSSGNFVRGTAATPTKSKLSKFKTSATIVVGAERGDYLKSFKTAAEVAKSCGLIAIHEQATKHIGMYNSDDNSTQKRRHSHRLDVIHALHKDDDEEAAITGGHNTNPLAERHPGQLRRLSTSGGGGGGFSFGNSHNGVISASAGVRGGRRKSSVTFIDEV
jgi:tetratricopeptide (TPR) repeat protein